MKEHTQWVERLEGRKRYLRNSLDRRSLLVHLFENYYSEEGGFNWDLVWKDHPSWQKLLGWDKPSLRRRVYVAAHEVKNMMLRRETKTPAQPAINGNGHGRFTPPTSTSARRSKVKRSPQHAQHPQGDDWPAGLPEFCPRCLLNLKMLAMSMGIALKHSPTLLPQ